MTRIVETTHRIEGFGCQGCAENLSAALRRLDGVIVADASFEDRTLTVRYDVGRLDVDRLRAAVEAVGFTIAGEDPVGS